MSTKIKICGVTQTNEIQLLDELGVSYSGLWYGIQNGAHNLDLATLTKLSSVYTQKLQHVLVTMLLDIDTLREAIDKSNIQGIQFHGFQLPAFITKVKQTFGDSITIFKVLHVRNDKCIEESLIERYLDAGTDVLILDSYLDNHQIGSTGVRLGDKYIGDFLTHWGTENKIMLAGGIDNNTIGKICLSHQPFGFDIDSAARSEDIISRHHVGNIMAQKTLIHPTEHLLP